MSRLAITLNYPKGKNAYDYCLQLLGIINVPAGIPDLSSHTFLERSWSQQDDPPPFRITCLIVKSLIRW